MSFDFEVNKYFKFVKTNLLTRCAKIGNFRFYYADVFTLSKRSLYQLIIIGQQLSL